MYLYFSAPAACTWSDRNDFHADADRRSGHSTGHMLDAVEETKDFAKARGGARRQLLFLTNSKPFKTPNKFEQPRSL
ncbi:hypothetical protein [Marivita sp.]|uniref:hypothetical protein n=1 Tax=Marivita sp. TaxID=2003365 RepID=UPI0025BFF9AD|nr:hypothetical protein [Marivita sp.]